MAFLDLDGLKVFLGQCDNRYAYKSHTHTYSQISDMGTHVYDATVSRTANTVLAAPNGSNGSATFRKLVAADIPTITKSKISDFPSSMPASDVYSWAKASSKPGYSFGEISGQVNATTQLTGTVPSSCLPSYVDDVLEYNGTGNFPKTGETGKIYTDTSTNKIYRWGGSSYVVISETLALGTTSSTAYRGDLGNEAHSWASTAVNHANAHGSAFASGLYKITTNSAGHVTAATAVTKDDITGLGIPGSDTNTWRPIVNNLTSTATDQSLSAAQGKALNDKFASYVPTSRTVNGKALSGNISLSYGDVGAAAASHSHSYLPLSGGTMTGRIARSSGGSWISARDNAAVYGGASDTGSYNVVVSQKTKSGSWNIGNLGGDERLCFSYDTDTNKNNGTNESVAVYMPTTTGQLALTSQIPGVGNGTVTITQNGVNKGSFTMNQGGNTTIALTDTDTNTTYGNATTSASGLMSASDKSKLDGITASADSVSFTRSLTSGTKVGTITINGTGTDIYCQTNTNTTYSAGAGLGLSGTTFSLSASGVTAGSYGPSGNVYGSNGATISVPQITVDAYGRVTSVTNRTYTSVNTDTNTTYSAISNDTITALFS